jgi:EmrB/QacA subfamily drug resistance transporter
MFMAAMEATVVATALPSVVADLNGLELYGWVTAGYLLATTVTIPLWGKLSDQWGRKQTLLAGLAVFLVGSAACALSRTMAMLIGFRVVQGVGSGALQPVALTVVGDLFTLDERARIQGLFGAVWGFAAIVGPLIGGVIVHSLSWHWIFWINAPPCILSAWLLVLFYADERRGGMAKQQLDIAGAVLLSGAVIALLAGVSGFSPTLFLPAAGLLLAAFLHVEHRAREPILPLSLFRVPAIAGASLCSALMGAAMMALITYTPLFAQATRHVTATEAGATIAPMLVGWPLAAALGGRILPRVGYRILVRGGLTLVGISSIIACTLVAREASLSALRMTIFLFGVGMGLANTALIIAVQQSVEFGERGVATASAMFFRNVGGAVAAGGLGVILAYAVGSQVPPDVLRRLLGPERGAGLDPALVARTSAALAEAMLPIFLASAGLGVLVTLAGWAFPHVRIERAPTAPSSMAPCTSERSEWRARRDGAPDSAEGRARERRDAL